MLGRETLGLVLGGAGAYQQALRELDLGLAQAKLIGSRVFTVVLTAEKAEMLLKSGREQEALSLAADLRADGTEPTWWFRWAMVTPTAAWLAPTHEAMNEMLSEGVSADALQRGMMMMLFHARAAEACWHRKNYARAMHHARALLELEPDAKQLRHHARLVLALSGHAQGSRDAALLADFAELRAEAEQGGFSAAVASIDRALAGAT
jgi:hypothetical protein